MKNMKRSPFTRFLKWVRSIGVNGILAVAGVLLLVGYVGFIHLFCKSYVVLSTGIPRTDKPTTVRYIVTDGPKSSKDVVEIRHVRDPETGDYLGNIEIYRDGSLKRTWLEKRAED